MSCCDPTGNGALGPPVAGCCTLAETLLAGNTSGATSIVMDAGQTIEAAAGAGLSLHGGPGMLPLVGPGDIFLRSLETPAVQTGASLALAAAGTATLQASGAQAGAVNEPGHQAALRGGNATGIAPAGPAFIRGGDSPGGLGGDIINQPGTGPLSPGGVARFVIGSLVYPQASVTAGDVPISDGANTLVMGASPAFQNLRQSAVYRGTLNATQNGSTDTAVLRFGGAPTIVGAAITESTTAAGGTVLTISEPGIYAVWAAIHCGTTQVDAGISRNQAAPRNAAPTYAIGGVVWALQFVTRGVFMPSIVMHISAAEAAAGVDVRFLGFQAAANSMVGTLATYGIERVAKIAA